MSDAAAGGQRDAWATLDDLWGIEVSEPVEQGIGPVAVYGRCSTEDNQDPETSRGWQFGNARKFVEPLGGRVVAEFFDIGQSRSVPWERRSQAGRLLAALKDPGRGWDALVVGEGTRCWFGNQFSLTAPKFAVYGVELWVPELGGRYDPRNPSHKMLMSVLGGMSESERQHVQARVRAAMDAQVLNEGRHQGGRAPYGYAVVDGGPHPNPNRAGAGFRLRVLVLDEAQAAVVARIFAEYLDGAGDRAIAAGLNRDGIPCPSASRPEQNRHRRADGWQGSTVRAILENPRYTGYAVFGRWTKHEELADPDDVAAGNVTRFRRSSPDRVVRSRRPAHPAVVSVEEFTQAQLRRRARAAGGMRGIATLERQRPATRPYLLRGLVRCGLCERKMQGGSNGRRVLYRCIARQLAPGSAGLVDHPKTINLSEKMLTQAINRWIGQLFDREHVDETVRALVDSQTDAAPAVDREAGKRRLAEAEQALSRFQAAIAAGVDPTALVEGISKAKTQRDAARAELANQPKVTVLDTAEVYAMIDSLGDVGAVIHQAEPEPLAKMYRDLRIQVIYWPSTDGETATASMGVGNECVRGATCAQTPRREVAHGCGDVRSPARISHRDAQVMDPDGSLTPLAGSSITRPRFWACAAMLSLFDRQTKWPDDVVPGSPGELGMEGCVLSGRAAAEGLLRGRRGRRLSAVGASRSGFIRPRKSDLRPRPAPPPSDCPPPRRCLASCSRPPSAP